MVVIAEDGEVLEMLNEQSGFSVGLGASRLRIFYLSLATPIGFGLWCFSSSFHLFFRDRRNISPARFPTHGTGAIRHGLDFPTCAGNTYFRHCLPALGGLGLRAACVWTISI